MLIGPINKISRIVFFPIKYLFLLQEKLVQSIENCFENIF